MSSPRACLLWLTLPLLAASEIATAQQVGDALEPPRAGGLEAVDNALSRLSGHRRVLVVGAHPDDEDNSLLTLVSRGLGGEAAYISLSRGEGGQNLIGQELGDGLGLIRSEELSSARRIEGDRQYFSRARDFGYTRSLDETLERWPREALLLDAARVVRRFKPQVIVSIFANGGGGTHGQHQMAGVVAHEVFPLAGDEGAFPELKGSGLYPWEPQALFRRVWRGAEDDATIELPLAGADPITGRSLGQIAAAARSMHRSQDMGRMQTLGPARTRVVPVIVPAESSGKGLFDGIDTRLEAIASTLPEGQIRAEVAQRLRRVASLAMVARGKLAPTRLDRGAEALLEILPQLRLARELASSEPSAAAREPVVQLLTEKIRVAEGGLVAAAGVAFDARADRERVVATEPVEVTATIWNSGITDLAVKVEGLYTVGSQGWPSGSVEGGAFPVAAGTVEERSTQVVLPTAAGATLPYFLRRPHTVDLYDWTAADPEVRGEPFGPPPLEVEFRLSIASAAVAVRREVVHAFGDQSVGEIRRPLRAVPALEVSVSPGLEMLRLGDEAGEIEVVLRSNVDRPLRGRVEIETPAGWPSVAPIEFDIADGHGGGAVRFALQAPTDLAPGRYECRVSGVLDSGETFAESLPVAEYSHVRPRPRAEPAVVAIEALDLRLPGVGRVGYLRGASDRVPEALAAVGLPLELLDVDDLADRDLSGFDVIVIGSRAYETDPALGRVNNRLLDYASKGGVVIVQYQQYQFARGSLAPFEFDISRPHDRITDENSPVRVLEPEHRVFHSPNVLTEADWEGWVQERGLYFAGTWGEEFTPLLAMQDPDGPERLGGLLVASLGEGHYVYTGLSFFREIPAGVPGAYRLLANLLALGEES